MQTNKSKNQNHISSGAVIYVTEKGIKKFLIMYRKKSNSWHLPKGTRVNGESLKETAVREVEEETGLNINTEKYIGKLNSTFERRGKIVHKETHYFLARPLGKNLLVNNHDREHDEVYFLEYKTARHNLKMFSLFEKEAEILTTAWKMLR
jgi:8-oxo-dGTP pyrophosphatase MutT (NUDIX family)